MNSIKTNKINSNVFILFPNIIMFTPRDLSTVYKSEFTTKTDNEEKIEATEEYLKIKNTTVQVNINKKLNP